MIGSPVLLLNQNYEPLNICAARRAIVMLGVEKAEVIEYGIGLINTPSGGVQIPSVIKLNYLVKRPIPKIKLSRREIFIRDNFTCLYCGKMPFDLTIDHVVPRYRGGEHSWDNLVTACIPCNHRKAGRTPREAGMALAKRLVSKPRNPYARFINRPILEEWRKFIPINKT